MSIRDGLERGDVQGVGWVLVGLDVGLIKELGDAMGLRTSGTETPTPHAVSL